MLSESSVCVCVCVSGDKLNECHVGQNCRNTITIRRVANISGRPLKGIKLTQDWHTHHLCCLQAVSLGGFWSHQVLELLQDPIASLSDSNQWSNKVNFLQWYPLKEQSQSWRFVINMPFWDRLTIANWLVGPVSIALTSDGSTDFIKTVVQHIWTNRIWTTEPCPAGKWVASRL